MVTDALAFVGVVAIGVLMFARVPGVINDAKEALSIESVRAQAVEISSLISFVSSSPDYIEITHKLPSTTDDFKLTVEDGYVTVEEANRKGVGKTFSTVTFGPDTVKELSITKNEIRKVA